MDAHALSIFEGFYNCLNAGDVDGALALVADDAVLANPGGTFTGHAQIRPFLQHMADTGHAFAFHDVRSSGGRVHMGYRIFRDGQLVEHGADGLTIVRHGQIVFDGTEATEAR
jgi:hypothetical protein